MLSEAFNHYRHRVENQLVQRLERRTGDSLDPILHQAMHYSLLSGGKRLRPILVYLSNQICGGDETAADAPAAAIEAIHSYSLVHDDLPAMDDDDLRRGQPTSHIKYDEATAILVGDALLTWAFEIISETAALNDSDRQLEMVRCLSRASGDLGMVAGQSFDLRSVGKSLTLEQLKGMHRAKTGALINAALDLGAISANALKAERAALNRYGQALGLAFQIKDDLLDVEGDTDTLGKPQGSDIARNKPTYPALVGLERSKEWLVELQTQAISELDLFGERAALLTELAQYVTERDH